MTRALVALASIAALGATSAQADSLGATSYRLANGLEVILAPDASAGAVAVHVRYRAGTADDPPDQEGLARVVRHFAGSKHVQPAFDRMQAIEDAGGWDTWTLGTDHLSATTYVPASALARVLYYEADRMAGYPDGVGPHLTENFRKIEWSRREPMWRDGLERALWSADHREADIRDGVLKVTGDDVKAWWRRFGVPGNATLVIDGAFDPAEAKRLVERYFAWIPAGHPAALQRAEVRPLGRVVDIATRGRTTETTLAIGFRAPPPTSSTNADLDIAARIIAAGRTSRLYRRLVTADRVASEVSTSFAPSSSGSQLALEITIPDQNSLAAVRAAVFDELAKVRSKGVTADEVSRAKAAALHDKFLALESLAFRAENLAAWAAYGDDFDRWRARLDAVTASSLQATAKMWLVEDAAVVISVLPVRR